ncbi:hypothetical protein V5O48_013570 [Marasmius crinis-equi]|uniref:Uncharacterized protein n=1 Tax=Marasmius crinis-equi TaxID=585013 RepID=A0ABR3F038_9AGAR
MTFAQRKKMNEKRTITNRQIKTAVAQKLQELMTWAKEQGRIFGKKDRYFKDMIFNGGVQLKHLKQKTSPYNAWRAEKAREIREGAPKTASDNDKNSPGIIASGKPQTLAEIDENFGEQYDTLTDKEKEELVARHKLLAAENAVTKIRLPTQKQVKETVKNVVENMIAMVRVAMRCVGMDGFFLLVRSRHDITIAPQWYCTNTKLENYLALAVKGPWDLEKFAARCEAFCVAGFDVTKIATTAQQRASFLKTEIVSLIQKLLAAAIGVESAEMNYKQFKKAITVPHGVVIEGWPLDRFVCPSDLGSHCGNLQTLLDALTKGTCYFRKMRSDAGIKRGPRAKNGATAVDEDDDDEDDADDMDADGDDNDNGGNNSTLKDVEVTAKAPAKQKLMQNKNTGATKEKPAAATGEGEGGGGGAKGRKTGGKGKGKVTVEQPVSSPSASSTSSTPAAPRPQQRPRPRKITSAAAATSTPNGPNGNPTIPESAPDPAADTRRPPPPPAHDSASPSLDVDQEERDSVPEGAVPDSGDVELQEIARGMKRRMDCLEPEVMLAPGAKRSRVPTRVGPNGWER